MTTTSMLFLLLFLPLALIIYYIANDGIKEYVLLGESILFYALGDIHYLPLFCIATCVMIFIGRGIHISNSMLLKRILLVLGIIINIGILFSYKYLGSIIEPDTIRATTAIMPLGLSFFTFKSISYLADAYTGKVSLSEHMVHDALYLSIFTQIQAGPLTRYNDMQRSKKFDSALFSDGVYRFLIGFSKKILIADVLSKITTEVFATSIDNLSTGYAWLGAVCYSLQLFFDFAGYSDMAIGLTQMFGYKCKENFNYPYMTNSVSGFWRRWHISLSEWFRDYVYIPLGGSRNKQKWRTYVNLLIVWILTGIWHGSSWNFVLWGLGYFIMIAFEKATNFPAKLNTTVGKILYRIVCLLFINFQWVLFNAGSVTYGLGFIKRMVIGKSVSLANLRALFLLKEYFFFILIALILCFPIVPWIQSKFKERKVLSGVLELGITIIIVAAFVWALSFVISGLNNPFAYANF